MLKICIVDDEIEVHHKLEAYLEQYASEKQVMFIKKFYFDGAQFLQEYPSDTNIVFLDIEMAELDGMETALKLRSVNPDISIVFITNLTQYAIRGYEVDALDYLVKPVKYEDFSRMMDKVVNRSKKKEYNITVAVEDGFRKINLYDVLYMESDGAYVRIHTADHVYSIKKSLKELEQKLEQAGFLRCNHCYLVNTKYVTDIGADTVKLKDVELKISRGRKKEFLGKLAEKLGNEMMS